MRKVIIIALIFGALLSSCTSESVTPDPTFSDVTWYASTPLKTTGSIAHVKGKTISIFDLSQGAISHEWTIMTGTHFLKTGFSNSNIPGTTTPVDATPFIDATKGLSTTDKTVFVYFPTAGNYTITLKNTYKNKVTYNGTSIVDAVLVDGVWVFEQVFNVTVN